MPRRINVIEKIVLEKLLVIKRKTSVPPSFFPLLNTIMFGSETELIKVEVDGVMNFIIFQSYVGGLFVNKKTDEQTFQLIWDEAIKSGNKILKS